MTFFYIFHLRWCNDVCKHFFHQKNQSELRPKIQIFIKSGNDDEIFEDSLEVWNLIQSGWFFFLQFRKSLKFCKRAEPQRKSYLMFLVGHPNTHWSEILYGARKDLFFVVNKVKISHQNPKTKIGLQNQYGRIV
jgi:hypothetical protein